MTNNDDFQALVYNAWDTFRNCYNLRYDRYPSRYSKLSYPAFNKIANICLEHDFNVHDYITRCFSLLEKNGIYITPNDFTSDKMLQRYIKWLEDTKTTRSEVELEFESQTVELVKICKAYNITPEKALYSPQNPFLSWFRLFYLEPLNVNILEAYGPDVWLELRTDSNLKNYLTSIRPKNMKDFEQCYET